MNHCFCFFVDEWPGVAYCCRCLWSRHSFIIKLPATIVSSANEMINNTFPCISEEEYLMKKAFGQVEKCQAKCDTKICIARNTKWIWKFAPDELIYD